ncbi:MAG: hypothetical protein LWW74_05050 [Burkholderiales bacterium]|nr:hypothetical protein [Burkholderiales bacterium]MCE1176630.1 hypothetical protein [Burkholderiales bacterium]
MNLVKRHPEAHDAWLYAMGIDVRWRHRSGLSDEVALDAPALELPECIVQSRYWVLGEQPLTDAQAHLLVGMLWAIGAQDTTDCTYSHVTDSTQTTPQTIATGLPTLAIINTLAVEPVLLQIPVDALHTTTLIVMSDALMAGQTHERLLRVPSLQAMIDNPLLKKDAWAVLKKLRA